MKQTVATTKDSSVMKIANLALFLRKNLDCIKSATKDEIICVVDTKELRITRSHSFYDGGKYIFMVACDEMPMYRYDYGSPRHPEKIAQIEVDQLFDTVNDLFADFRDTLRVKNQNWFLGRFS